VLVADSLPLLMSVTITHQQRYTCAHDDCNNTRTQTSSVDGSYCSRDCADRSAGQAFLQDIKQDHRFCWSCFRQRKRVERPPKKALRGLGRVTADAVIGYQSPTPAVQQGDYGLECTCGAVDHNTPDYTRRTAGPYSWYLANLTRRLRADGRRDTTIDPAQLADELWNHGSQDVSLELAVGRALNE